MPYYMVFITLLVFLLFLIKFQNTLFFSSNIDASCDITHKKVEKIKEKTVFELILICDFLILD